MRNSIIRAVLAVLVASMALVSPSGLAPLSPAKLFAQDQPPVTEARPEPNAFKRWIEQIQKYNVEIHRPQNPLADDTPPHCLAMLEVAHIDSFYNGQGHSRYLALQLILANPTSQAIVIPRENVTVQIDGEKRPVTDLPRALLNYSISTTNRSYNISTIKPPKEWKVPAEGHIAMWLIYPDLPIGSSIPECHLTLKIGNTTTEFDVNQEQTLRLGLHVERIGPRQSLALITIRGTLTSFNTGTLVQELNRLSEEKVARCVVRWSEKATPPDARLNQWLQNAAAGNAGNPNHLPAYPGIPTSIREFHVAEYPLNDEAPARPGQGQGLRATPQPRVHRTAAEAVAAALRTAYLALPRDELLAEIRGGHPLSRAAALAYGGGRLSIEQLPQIFAWAEESDPELQKAALQTLSHFGEPAAIEKLIYFARRDTEPLSTAAIESLAGSRFGAAHDALLNLLKNESVGSKKKIVQVLAKYPRPIWSDALYEFVTTPSSGMDVESLRALVHVGHPKLVDVLGSALNSNEKPIRDLAFQELSRRGDERSETLAVNHALKLLEAGPPDASMVGLLSRTKDPRAIPLLIKQIDKGGERVNAISLLLQIGDQGAADFLVEKYHLFTSEEKVQVLQGIRIFHHPGFYKICGEALLSNENKLVATAANVLKDDGQSDGERQLVAALEQQKNSAAFRNITNALANFATPSARAALIKVRETLEGAKRDEINKALAILSQRSPGFQFVLQGLHHREQQQKKEALEAFDLAEQLDSLLPEVFLHRGKYLLAEGKYDVARKDFEKVVELQHEPNELEFGEFVTGLSITRIVEGNINLGLSYLESHRQEATKKSTGKLLKYFFYNAACAYSRAVEQVDNQSELPDRDSLREKYRKQAIQDLTDSIKHGFDEYDWMAQDHDFTALRNDPDFLKLLANKPATKPDEKTPAEDE